MSIQDVRETPLEMIHGYKEFPCALTDSDCQGSLRKEKAVGSDLNRFFSRMGARIKVLEAAPVSPRFRGWVPSQNVPQIVIDIRDHNDGEFFEIRTAPGSRCELDVLTPCHEKSTSSCSAVNSTRGAGFWPSRNFCVAG